MTAQVHDMSKKLARSSHGSIDNMIPGGSYFAHNSSLLIQGMKK